jgi:hypothetical protein
MDLPQNENRNQKLILPGLLFLFGLALGILGSTLFFQGKIAKIQSQLNSVQPPQGQSLPIPPSVREPSNLPDKVPPSNGEKTPLPLPNVPEPPKSPDRIPSTNGEKIPLPLP